jgi:uncharacterized protein YyaL (SSP411 family)
MANRLAREKSPYLLQHAHNPVDWYPWGEEAFAKARAEDKPIFLSIGYSTCHWCHVMERESFENPAIAAVLNAHFVAIKVDREERPDIDHIYMTAVQATTGSGGWPMSVWLTPDLKPFFCGTYFPPESRYGRPGFPQLLERIHEVWTTNRAAVVAQAGEITALLDQPTGTGTAPAAGALDARPLTTALRQFQSSFDAEHGGFGGAPKFPRPVVFNFLFRAGGEAMALHTLRKMAEGGLCDQLGGGFHRYSVDEHWLVPHFEKMLYDQAQLVSSYCDAFQITGDPFFADIARRTCQYVLRDLTAPDGGFYAAEDADSEGVEGKFYVWSKAEIADDAICQYYGVTEAGNWEDGHNILHVAGHPAPPHLEEWRQKLLAIRSRRVRPHRDEKIITAWNGLMISALCRAHAVAGLPAALPAAERAAARYLRGELSRTAHGLPAVLDDYAAVATAFADLYETTFHRRYLHRATELADTMIRLFADEKAGGFFMTDGRDASVIVRPKEQYDGAEPSGYSLATLLLLRLGALLDRDDYRAVAEKSLQASAEFMNRAPHAVPQLLCALDWWLHPPQQIVFAGDPALFLPVIHQAYRPRKVLLLADDATTPRPMVAGQPTVYVCENFACRPPITSREELRTVFAGPQT